MAVSVLNGIGSEVRNPIELDAVARLKLMKTSTSGQY